MVFGVGIAETSSETTDFSERIVNRFLEAEQTWQWQRWIEPLTAVAFGAIIIALPWLPDVRKSRSVIAGGLTFIVFAELIDSVQEVAIDNARFTLDNGATEAFAAFNVSRFMLDATSRWIWVGGAVLLAAGLAILILESNRRTWRIGSALFAITVLFFAIGGFFIDTSNVDYTLMTLAMIYWTLSAARILKTS
jgi:hypothetical protein